jgi:spermidine export protein MdtJ
MVALSYFFLAKAVKRISVAVAYAIWEGSGIALITLITACVFGHVLSAREWVGLAMALAGILMVNAGEVHHAQVVSINQTGGLRDAVA